MNPEPITIEEFKKCDLRVGTVVAASRVEGSEKLLKLMIDLGESEPRQILSGIGKWYEPADLLHKVVVVIANLAPRMMMGLESRGMLLAANGGEGKPVILTAAGEVAPGAPIT